MARSNFVTWAFLGEKVKKVDFSKTIAACDLKLIELNEDMLVLEVKVFS